MKNEKQTVEGHGSHCIDDIVKDLQGEAEKEEKWLSSLRTRERRLARPDPTNGGAESGGGGVCGVQPSDTGDLLQSASIHPAVGAVQSRFPSVVTNWTALSLPAAEDTASRGGKRTPPKGEELAYRSLSLPLGTVKVRARGVTLPCVGGVASGSGEGKRF
ncbi:hypothetical protein SKAU_G00198230 [Synaphobranchus kaupii]|uniref:Uncharacterized protein n=1 Tax=Synaphobranchus kaupii TaxID=118154 RepID=A0A9Q1FF16_SYNKA|nr:hypothetical protein SKAU_G00198230 [Synaphobranchus kaupii]